MNSGNWLRCAKCKEVDAPRPWPDYNVGTSERMRCVDCCDATRLGKLCRICCPTGHGTRQEPEPPTPEVLAQARRQVTVMKRGVRADVRNPLLKLPAVEALQELPPESQAALRQLLKDISADARERADKCWHTHKAPMAAYWKAVAVYANHTSRLLAP